MKFLGASSFLYAAFLVQEMRGHVHLNTKSRNQILREDLANVFQVFN